MDTNHKAIKCHSRSIFISIYNYFCFTNKVSKKDCCFFIILFIVFVAAFQRISCNGYNRLITSSIPQILSNEKKGIDTVNESIILLKDTNDDLQYKYESNIEVNMESLDFLKKSWEYMMLHDEDERVRNDYKRNLISGNLMHRYKQLKLWASIANYDNILINSTVCEIGFAYGFSALVILNSNPFIKYIGFDIGEYVSKKAWNTMKDSFINRANIYWGDSSTSIYKLYDEDNTNILCDIWIVDGDHSYNGAKKDITSIIKTSNKLTRKYPNNLIIFDDCDLGKAPINPTQIDKEFFINHSWPIITAEGAAQHPTKVVTETIMDEDDNNLLYVDHGNEIDTRGKGVFWCITTLNNL